MYTIIKHEGKTYRLADLVKHMVVYRINEVGYEGTSQELWDKFAQAYPEEATRAVAKTAPVENIVPI